MLSVFTTALNDSFSESFRVLRVHRVLRVLRVLRGKKSWVNVSVSPCETFMEVLARNRVSRLMSKNGEDFEANWRCLTIRSIKCYNRPRHHDIIMGTQAIDISVTTP